MRGKAASASVSRGAGPYEEVIMRKHFIKPLLGLLLCLALLPATAALADETTGPCPDGKHTWGYGNPNCTTKTCNVPLRAVVSWESSSVGGYYTEVKNAFKDAQQHPDAAAYEINLLADAALDESVTVEHKGMFLRLNGCTLTLAPGGNAQSTLRVLPGGYLWIREGNTSGGKIVVAPTESSAEWVAGIELAGGKATFEGGELSVADPYNGSAECSVVRMTGSVGNVFDMDWASVLSGEGSYAVVADGSGPEVTFRVESEKNYGRIKITKNYPGSVQLYGGTFASLELEPDGKYQSLDQLLMSYRDYQDVGTGEIVSGSGKQTLENVEVVHIHVYDDEGRCKSGDFAYAHARIVNSPNAEVNRFYDEFEEALTIARLPENDGCTLELWAENPNANEKNGGVGYILDGGKFTLDLRDRCMDHDFVNAAPEYVLKHTGGELTLTASGGYELGYLRAYGPVKALGVDGGHVRIDDGRYMWIWHKDYDNEDNSGCIVELRSGELEIRGGTFSSKFSDKTPADEKDDPRIYLKGGNGPALLSVTGDAAFNTPIEIASDYTENGGKVTLSGGSFTKLVSKDTSLTIADMLAPGYVCRDADGNQMSLADLSTVTELENFSVAKCEHALKEDGGKYVCPYCNAELTVSAMQIPGGKPYYYTDLASALEGSARLSGQVLLTMLSDAKIAEQVRVTEGSYTLELNGRTLTCTVSGGNIVDASAILVTGGELAVRDSAGGGKVSVSADGGVGLCAVGGTLTVESGTYTADGASSIAVALGGDGTGETGTNGTVILTGGEFSPNGAGSEGIHVGNGGKALTVSGNVTVKSTAAETYYGVRIADGYQGTVSISAGTFSKIDIEAEGMTAADLLADGFQFQNSSGRWITDLTVTELTRTKVAEVPIRLGEMKDSYDVVYKAEGKNVITLEVFASESGDGFEEYDLFLEFECEDENGYKWNGSTGWADIDPDKKRAVFTLDGFLKDRDVGTYYFTVKSVKYHSSQLDEYKLPGKSFTVNVLKSGTEATVETGITDSWFDKMDTFTYGQRITVRAMFDATGELPVMFAMAAPVEDQCAVFNADGEQISEAEYEQSSGTWWLDIPGTALDVGTHALTVKYVGGANQTGMSVPFTVTVVPRPITALVQDETPLVYNGTALTREIASVEADGITLTAADYDVSGNTQTAAGTYELTVTGKGNFTGTLTGSYAIAPSAERQSGAGSLEIVNALSRTYEFDLAACLPEGADLNGLYFINDDTWPQLVMRKDGYPAPQIALNGSRVTLTFDGADADYEGVIAELTAAGASRNYADILVTLTVTATNKQLPEGAPTVSGALTYGEPLRNAALTGTMVGQDGKAVPGAFAWAAPDTVLDAGTHEAGWTFTPDDTDAYLTVSGTAAVTVNRARVTGAPVIGRVTESGVKLKDVTLDLSGLAPAGAFAWNDGGETEVEQGRAYGWTYTPTDAKNYETLGGEVTLWAKSSSGGGSGGGSSGGSTGTKPDDSKTETVTKPDGSKTETVTKPDGTKTETTTKPDGTKTETTTKPDGSKTETVTKPDGSTGTARTDKNGVTEIEIRISEKAAEDARKNGTPVIAPIEVKAGGDGSAPIIRIILPQGESETELELPVSNVNSGTVVVIVHPDGSEELLARTIPTEDGVRFRVDGDMTVKLIDNSRDFTDTQNHWSKDEVNLVAARGLFNGIGNGLFGVREQMTRGMVNTVLARLSGVDTTGGATWYEKGTEWAVANGITDGSNPTASVTREQLAAMLYRYAGSPAVSGELTFADADGVSGYAKDALLWAAQNGIINGVGGGRVAPKETAERAQVAAMLARYLKSL